MTRPTKQQILEKYRSVIDADDFVILERDTFPSPEELRQLRSSLQYLGKIDGRSVWAQRLIGGAIASILFIGDLDGGIQAINKYTSYGYDRVNEYLARAEDYPAIPAEEFVKIERPNDWPLPMDDTIYIAQAPSTTTTTPPPAPPPFEIPSGSSISPNSDRWIG